jgi:hypothetical protein
MFIKSMGQGSKAQTVQPLVRKYKVCDTAPASLAEESQCVYCYNEPPVKD